jgi:hypothetical protein
MKLHTPEIEPVRDATLGFGLVPQIWPFNKWVRGPLWRLEEAWPFAVMNNNFSRDYVIPAGYEFDKASIPPIFWGAGLGYTPDGLCTVAALEHDFLCDLYHGGSPWLKEQLGTLPPAPPATVIHQHFRDVLHRWGVRPSKELIMWAGVRALGPGGTLRPGTWLKKLLGIST